MRRERRNGARTGKVDPQARWWLIPEAQRDNELHEHIVAVCREIQQRQRPRLARLAQYKRCYDNYGLGAVRVSDDRLPVYQTRGGRLVVNFVRSITDTMVSRVGKSMPRPMYAPTKGTWSIQFRCQMLTQYMDGALSDLKRTKTRMLLDAGVFGTCADRVFKSGNGLAHERCLIDELIVDDEEGIYGDPRQMHQRRLIDRDVLKAKAKAWNGGKALSADLLYRIDTANGPRGLGATGSRKSNMVELFESWHLPSDEDMGVDGDGMHAMTIDGATIFHEPYTLSRFPITFLNYKDPERGFWGHGLVEEIYDLQRECTQRLKDVSDAMRLTAIPRWAVPEGSNFNKASHTNEMGAHYTYDAKQGEPHWVGGITMPPDTLNYIRWIESEAYKLTGISETSAAGRKEPGIESGVAIREVDDIEQGRLSMIAEAREDYYMRIAETHVMFARQMYEDDKRGPIAKAKAGKFVSSVPWKDVHLEEDQYEMRLFSTSQLPATPQGRLEFVTELAKGGLVEQREWLLHLLQIPDTDEFISLETAPLDNARRLVEINSKGDEYEPPMREMALELTTKIAINSYLRGFDEGMAEPGKRNLRRMLVDLRALIQERDAANAPPAPPPMPMGPGGPPMPGGPMPMDPMAGAGAPPMPEGVPQGLPTTPLLPAGVA